MNSKNVLIFTGGLIVGATSGILATMQYFKNKYSNIAEEQIAETENYFNNKYSKFDMAEDEAEVNPIREDNNDSSNTGRENGSLSKEKRDEIKEKLLKNHEITTNYAAIYNEKHDPNPVDELTEDELATAEHIENFGKPAQIITVDEYEALPSYIDRDTLYFYDLDEVVVDDEDEVIEDPTKLVGNCLEGFVDSTDDIIFIWNPSIDTAYEIQRVPQAYYKDGDL